MIGENCKGTGVISLIPNAEMGFLPVEACFLVQIMKELGVKFLFFAAVGAVFGRRGDSEYIYNLGDACDITTMHCCTRSSPKEFLTDIRPFNEAEEILSNCKCGAASYFQFTGPTYPTPSEQKFANLDVGNTIMAGITNT